MTTRTAPTWAAATLLLASFGATAQVQSPPNSVPVGESRLPTENPALPQTGVRPGGDDCNRQAEAIRQQFRIQESNVRREIADRTRVATGADKERIRQEGEQRLASLRLEAAEAERRVMTSCRG
jgi:hypothetical protein